MDARRRRGDHSGHRESDFDASSLREGHGQGEQPDGLSERKCHDLVRCQRGQEV